MLKKTVKYTDFFGQKQEEELYFHMTKDELADIEFEHEGGLEQQIEQYLKDESVKDIFALIKRFVMGSYGEISDDGRRFVKDEEKTKMFSQSAAYEALMTNFMNDPAKFDDFLMGVMPADLVEQVKAQMVQDKPKGPPPIPSIAQ